MTEFLKIEGLSAWYGGLQAIDGVSLEVAAHEAVCIVGPNGAGKSTMLMSISGVIRKKKGVIQFEDSDLSGAPAYRIARSGIMQVPEGRRIFAGLTVAENLKGNILRGRVLRTGLETVYGVFPALYALQHRRAGQLSGGEQQMLAIGRALMTSPKLLLLDEPSLGLSPIMVDAIYEQISTLVKEGMSILLVEQNADLATDVCSRAYVMSGGQIEFSGEAEAVRDDVRLQEAYLGVA